MPHARLFRHAPTGFAQLGGKAQTRIPPKLFLFFKRQIKLLLQGKKRLDRTGGQADFFTSLQVGFIWVHQAKSG